jgi:uncharacterized membrane protein SpoIIM required for sporulation
VIVPQDQFVAARRRDWEELDQLISRSKSPDGTQVTRMGALYRSVCNDLAHAEASRYTPDMLAYLHNVAGRTHNILYKPRPARLLSAVRFLLVDFPVALRNNGRLFALACLLFLVPWAVGLFGALGSREFAESVLPAQMIEQMEQAYSESLSRGRAESVDAAMAGFYVFNNIGIAFRCFATGLVFGLGSIYFLVYNGLIIGTTSGAVMAAGYGENIWTFMCGHGPFEIIAIFVSGGAGLQMGYALVATDGLTRFGSLRRYARDITAQVVGAAVMLGIAAALEAFWSPSSAPHEVKWAVGGLNLLLVVGFLTFAGRGSQKAATGSPA